MADRTRGHLSYFVVGRSFPSNSAGQDSMTGSFASCLRQCRRPEQFHDSGSFTVRVVAFRDLPKTNLCLKAQQSPP
jgi:hypothetical protein